MPKAQPWEISALVERAMCNGTNSSHINHGQFLKLHLGYASDIRNRYSDYSENRAVDRVIALSFTIIAVISVINTPGINVATSFRVDSVQAIKHSANMNSASRKYRRGIFDIDS